ncbi:MAG: hypothetical protein H0X25_10205 [Acidobacteriales bacterium]|nr:hypothetical protein [Terriglobales bacterium]
MKKAEFFLSVVAAVLATVVLSIAQGGTYTQVDYPHAVNTDVTAINEAGEVVGTYLDEAHFRHGFLLSGGVFTFLDFGSKDSSTVAQGINDVGQIVGYALNGQGFAYDVNTNSFYPYDYPGVSGTYPVSMNNNESLVGILSPDGGILDLVGFQCFQSKCRQITPDGFPATIAGVTDTGAAFGTLNLKPFQLSHGRYRSFMIPGEPDAYVFGVNFAGTALVGWLPSFGDRAFLYKPGSVTILEYPGSPNTQAYGVNNSGVVVGDFVDSLGSGHGFIWTPPTPAK